MPKSKVKELLQLDYNQIVQLTKKENAEILREDVTRMMLAANRRINKLNSNPIGKYSPALKSLNNAGIKKFTTKGINKMSTNDLVHQYTTLKKFMTAKSSTLAGWNNIRAGIGKRTGAKKLFQTSYKSARSAAIWQNREKRFWSLYNKLIDNYGGIITQLDSNRVQQMLMTIQTKGKKSDDDISNIMNTYIEKLYEAASTGEVIDDANFEQEYNIKF